MSHPTNSDSDSTPSTRRLVFHAILVASLGALLGTGIHTFRYAKGVSYLSNDPKACMNCHIMRPQFDSWQKSSHHTVATCNDCHLPHGLISKYIAKSSNGWHHSKAFTLQNFHEPIQIKPMNSEILQKNCLFCHGALVHPLVTAGLDQKKPAKKTEMNCVHCHASVGHGERAGLGGPFRPDELPTPKPILPFMKTIKTETK